ncbi:DUF4440 domain-containing protein [Schumannella luteola]|uniref:DUF4440 domain-containing protein n=1 Tax=Schumannella luteola TaxID=472059 RepID=A0A852YS80_9MICO|nr:DUF4440 domain-containing protein [Schumannella luteola]NYH00116.1 hypothetical protein [Schumannella luteola]TPX06665.1 DUF4440 domain-containing protein [Schumannella luteola]
MTDQITAELRALEPLFHVVPAASPREHVSELIADDFWEIGASGAIYSRDAVIDALAERGATPNDANWEVSDFAARELAPELWLVTYQLVQDAGRTSRRTTIWRRTDGRWVAEFHQGTLI